VTEVVVLNKGLVNVLALAPPSLSSLLLCYGIVVLAQTRGFLLIIVFKCLYV
jgi:hypothetical protein